MILIGSVIAIMCPLYHSLLDCSCPNDTRLILCVHPTLLTVQPTLSGPQILHPQPATSLTWLCLEAACDLLIQQIVVLLVAKIILSIILRTSNLRVYCADFAPIACFHSNATFVSLKHKSRSFYRFFFHIGENLGLGFKNFGFEIFLVVCKSRPVSILVGWSVSYPIFGCREIR